ncbi:response regulator transcription factor [Nocardioides iriomotensis]|jgi:CheY-like chemotaxis protein|uniref:Response regulator n=1 Tax=Nocardioides iriomotensis TaxID=715784 RepID=A0A4Q5IVG4_9ACTN|nr:response regulator [Nocardioides iriomotensis]RYU10020.1 response regulator [Nocardioides iriomotensis]
MTPPRGRVLVVDDAPAIRELIAVNLELEGYDVDRAGDGEEALAAVARQRPDVITLDVMMPRLDGFSTIERLRSDPDTADIPVVLVTGRASAADRARGELLGVDGFLAKPFEPAELLATIQRLTGGAPVVD